MSQPDLPNYSLEINGEEVLITLDDSRVDSISFSFVIDIEVSTSGDSFIVKLITEFDIVSATGSYLVEPEEDRQSCSTVLSLLHRSVASITSTAEGLLFVRFVDGTELRSRCHDQYEAWHLRGQNAFLVVALPGGGVAVWEPGLAGDKENTG